MNVICSYRQSSRLVEIRCDYWHLTHGFDAYHRFMRKFLAVIFIGLSFTLSGCEKQATAEEVAIQFFQAIYVDKDVDKAKQLSMPALQELLTHYHTARMVQRHVIGLTMNDPVFDIANSTSDFLKKVSTEVVVKVRFRGNFDGSTVEDDRSLLLVKNGLNWQVKEIEPDIFLSNG